MFVCKVLYILLSMTLTCCVRFDYYTHHNPAVLQRRSSLTSTLDSGAKNDQREYKLTGFKINNEHEIDSFKDEVNKGKHDNEVYKKQYGGDGGHKSEKHEGKDQEDAKKVKAESSKGSKVSQKKGHKKGHKTKGWHNTFFRDEFHKEHKFYDDEHKSGEYEKHGAAEQRYEKQAGTMKKGAQHRAKHTEKKKGRKGHHSSGRNDKDQKGFNHKQSDESNHHNSQKFGKNTKSQRGKHFAYNDRHK